MALPVTEYVGVADRLTVALKEAEWLRGVGVQVAVWVVKLMVRAECVALPVPVGDPDGEGVPDPVRV